MNLIAHFATLLSMNSRSTPKAHTCEHRESSSVCSCFNVNIIKSRDDTTPLVSGVHREHSNDCSTDSVDIKFSHHSTLPAYMRCTENIQISAPVSIILKQSFLIPSTKFPILNSLAFILLFPFLLILVYQKSI